ncbi:hypothetical protein HMPREF3201_00405 [Megasphaera sp. MJR8396C]|nr:hypothetical protein HMPREF3201_00405 [Megasphaera sp. MJR8396C]
MNIPYKAQRQAIIDSLPLSRHYLQNGFSSAYPCLRPSKGTLFLTETKPHKLRQA